MWNLYIIGTGDYDQLPITMTEQSIGRGESNSTYSTLDMGSMDPKKSTFDRDDIPAVPDGNNQVAAWYDTDL